MECSLADQDVYWLHVTMFGLRHNQKRDAPTWYLGMIILLLLKHSGCRSGFGLLQHACYISSLFGLVHVVGYQCILD
jgi:hypothetical protein